MSDLSARQSSIGDSQAFVRDSLQMTSRVYEPGTIKAADFNAALRMACSAGLATPGWTLQQSEERSTRICNRLMQVSPRSTLDRAAAAPRMRARRVLS